VMINVEQKITAINMTKIRDWMPTWADIKQCTGAMIRSSGVGFFLGLLPGCAPSVTTFVAYDLEKRVSRHPERFGHGAIEGVAAPEGANNATSTAGFIPLFSFGLPTAPSMAVLLGGLMMYGLQPGPMLFKQNPEFVWAVIASMYIGNVMLLVLNLPLVGMWAKIAVIPFYILGPLIIFFSVVGTYSIRFLAFDVWAMLIFGVIGYFMRKLGFPVAPMVLASVLAQMLETSLAQALLISQGSPFIFFTRPISAVFMALAILSIGRGIWVQVKTRAPEVALDEAD
jgi:putative tricarboxylic transport membrane protein